MITGSMETTAMAGNDDLEVVLRALAKQVAAPDHNDRDPKRAADRVDAEEFQVGHFADAGNERNEGAENRREARGDDGPGAVLYI